MLWIQYPNEVQKEGKSHVNSDARAVSRWRWFTEHLVWQMKAVTTGLQKTRAREGTTKEQRGSERDRELAPVSKWLWILY